MKIGLITDIHYGIRSDYKPYLENNKKFFSDVFFPTMEKQGVKSIVCLGDLLDRRKYINFLTAYHLRNDFINQVLKYDFHWILGNHDIYYRDTLEVNAANELCGFTNIKQYDEAAEVEFDGTKILFVPWICSQNREQVFDLIQNSKSQILFGHLEIDGCEMQPGINNIGGMHADAFRKFDIVLSGHFHQQSTRENIRYLGAHAEFIWSDYNQSRGFYIFDTDSRVLQFFKNPFIVFRKVYYDDAKGFPSTPNGGFESLQRKIIKVIISGKNDPLQYDTFIKQVEDAQPLDIQVVDDHLNVNLTNDSEIISESKDTLQIIREYIKQSNNVVNTNKLDNLIVGLYNQAQAE